MTTEETMADRFGLYRARLMASLTDTTVKGLQGHVGREGSITVGNLSVRVKVLDARVTYGRIQVLVTPLAGNGETWVDAARVAS